MTQDWRQKREKEEKNMSGGKYKRVMLPLEEAQDIIYQLIVDKQKAEPKVEEVHINDAGGRLLAQDIVAHEPVPHFDRSPLDGYGIRAVDTHKASPDNPVTLRVIDETPAGHYSDLDLTAGTAVKLFTGAPLPAGGDAIIRYEEVTISQEIIDGQEFETITIKGPVKVGQSVATLGEDIPLGQKVLSRGDRIRAGHVGILVSLGYQYVQVIARPKIAIFSTGDELIPVEEKISHGKIRASNLYTIAEMIRELGADPIIMGTAMDNLAEVQGKFETALASEADLIISTGGVSTGDYDVVKDAMKNVGAENVFWKVAIRPGAPVAVSVKDGKVLVGLSGNPAGAIVVALLLLAPVIAKLTGIPSPIIQRKAHISAPITRERGLRGFMWGSLQELDKLYVDPLADQHCGIVKSYAFCDCLIEVPAGKVDIAIGDEINVWQLNF